MDQEEDPDLPHLRIYEDRSVLYEKNGKRLQVFREGGQSTDAKNRAEKIRKKFSEGFLGLAIKRCREGKAEFDKLSDQPKEILKGIIDAVTSEFGRGIVVLSILQMAIKAIEPDQIIRLHKAGRGDFSWSEGVTMRRLDEDFVTPFLRDEKLLNMNKWGAMMTRSLAENYPYTRFYKAALRGPKKEWTALVDLLESGQVDAKVALDYSIWLLIKRSERFQALATEVVELAKKKSAAINSPNQVLGILMNHTADPGLPAARLLEVSMHSLMQSVVELHALGDLNLSRLSQMRQANKKAGNIADIELTAANSIVEAWDAKYGKPYLYDELLELHDKLMQEEFPALDKVGFVTDAEPDLRKVVSDKIEEIANEFSVSVSILTLKDWTATQMSRVPTSDRVELARHWLIAYAESLALYRPKIAPIDEPTESWLQVLKKLLS